MIDRATADFHVSQVLYNSVNVSDVYYSVMH